MNFYQQKKKQGQKQENYYIKFWKDFSFLLILLMPPKGFEPLFRAREARVLSAKY